ncbi:MAG: Trehalose utilization, partial [Armatimonadetes bacterium]|nr:Trehalose utilization [Armatimonadota bacterium]
MTRGISGSNVQAQPAARLLRPFFLLLACLALLAGGSRAAVQAASGKKVVFIAGKKSHGPGDHEYELGCKLLARCLETSPNLKGVRTEVHLNGWPENPKTLEDADTIVVYCDGSDHNEADHPLLVGDRLQVLDRQMKRGAGIVMLHYTTFAPVKRGGPEYLEWTGGFFDYETGPAANHWYSKIQTAATTATPATPGHPIARGLAPFPLREEYYYRMRHRENDPRRVPILTTELPNETGPQEVAWAVQRKDGGRGFAYTGGHFHKNWTEVESLRKMVLNAIVWTAKKEVPKDGVRSLVSPNTQHPTPNTQIRALLITGNQHPAHDWRATTIALREILTRDPRIQVDVTEDPEQLATRDLTPYQLIIQNFNNWETKTLSEASRAKLLAAVRGGKGLIVVHFANGAWLDWPGYRRLSRRVWLDGLSGHDPYGGFRVQVTNSTHPITQGLPAFDTVDELYYRQHGIHPVAPLVTARSRDTGKDEPLAFVYQEGKGRVYQSLLGHSAESIRTPGTAALYIRAAAWVAHEEPATVAVSAAAPPSRTAAGRWGTALNARGAAVSAPAKPEYAEPPLTVECWTRLNSKVAFNILVAQAPKESSTHWELYTTAGTGTYSVYLPGSNPSVLDSGVPLVDGQWHHVAMTREVNHARLYVDGKLVKDARLDPAEGTPRPGPVWFGAYPPQGIGCDGLIDDVRISRGVRPIVLPTAALTTDEATLGLWSFDSPAAGRYPDSSKLANAAVDPSLPTLLVQPPSGSSPLSEIRALTDTRGFEPWPNVGNDKGGMRYSKLKQIDTKNVKDLEVAWAYHTGDSSPGTTIECTPIVVNGIMYVTTVQAKIVALDPTTGSEIWKFDPFAIQPQNPIRTSGNVSRGVAYWNGQSVPGVARFGSDARIFFGTSDGRLVSVDAFTGRLDPKFGVGGVV